MSDPIARLNAALSDRYRIERELGAGGMATVYLAHDERHDRNVALKVLKPELAAVVGADRFLAEIRTTANLQHPHILPLFDSGEADAFLFYVMPYVEGESLRDRLDREGELPVEEALRIATAVASALDYAHRHGVIHRDIKPANILLHDGEPLVADFGIALAVSAAGGGRLTETGLSLGTPYYMSPEQATADRDPDARSDVYAMGCVLYEMLVGEPPYTGSSAQAVLGKILTTEPVRPTEHRRTVPRHLEAAVLRALEKRPADRFASAADFANALGDKELRAAFGSGSGRATPSAVSLLSWAVAALLLALLMWQTMNGPRSTQPAVRHLNVALPDSIPMIFVGEAPYGIGNTAVALSPDGQTLVYVGPADSTTRLYQHQMDGSPVSALPGTEGAYAPFFSADGGEVGFFVGPRLLRTTLEGQVQPVTDTNETYGGTWSTDGRIAVVSNDGLKVTVVSPTGVLFSTHEVVGRGFWAVAHPHWIPGSEWILLTCFDPRHVCAMSAETGEIRSLRTDGQPPSESLIEDLAVAGSSPRYVAPGYLVYVAPSRNAVLGVPFDPDRLTVLADPQPLLEGVRREGAQAAMQLAVSALGDVVFAHGANAEVGRLVWAHRGERLDTLHFMPPRAYGLFHLSPGGERLAIKVYPEVGPGQLWLVDLVRQQEIQWVDDGVAEGDEMMAGPWLGDSRTALANSYGSLTRLYEIDTRRGSGAEVLWEGDIVMYPEAVAPDGRVLVAIERRDGPGNYVALLSRDEILNLPARPNETVPPLIDRVGGQGLAEFSPDGRWLTYASDESGTLEAYALPLPGPGNPIRISTDGGELPTWTPQGDGLYYRDGRRWYWVPATDSEVEPFGTPELYLTGDFLNVQGTEHAVSPDGKRLLLLQAGGKPSTSTLDFVIGWGTELATRLGNGR